MNDEEGGVYENKWMEGGGGARGGGGVCSLWGYFLIEGG